MPRLSGRCPLRVIGTDTEIAPYHPQTLPLTKLGSQRAIAGQTMIIAITRISKIMYGTAAKMISSIFTSGGATPFMTNRSIPKGDVSSPSSMLIRKRTPNQTESKPRAVTI